MIDRIYNAHHDEHLATPATVAADIARSAPESMAPPPAEAILLLTALARHDGMTYTHSLRVAWRAWELALALGCSDEHSQRAFAAGLLHDVGKINIPASTLQKPGPLNELEWKMMRRHSLEGVRLLQCYPSLGGLVSIVAAHHERPDGLGYPLGLRLPDIHPIARVIAVVDAVDVMLSRRPYAAPLSVPEAQAELLAGAGTHWDYDVVMAAVESLTWSPTTPVASWRILRREAVPVYDF